MGRPSETVDTAMLASAIRIDAGIEADVRAVVVGQDRSRRVAQKNRTRQRRRLVVILRILVVNVFDALEAVLRIPTGTAALNRRIGGIGDRHRSEATAHVKKFYGG